MKIHSSRFHWKAFSGSFWLGKHFPLHKIVEMLGEVVAGWREVRWIWRMKQHFVGQLVHLLKCWLCDLQLSWRTVRSILLTNASYKHCSFLCISLICWAYFSDVMVSTGILKAEAGQMGSRPPNSDMTFSWCKSGFEKCFGTSQSNHWAGHHWLSYKIHFSSHVTIWSGNGSLLLQRLRDNTSKWYFLTCSELRRHPLLELSLLTNLLQIPKDHRMVDTEFSRNFLFSCERISFDDCS